MSESGFDLDRWILVVGVLSACSCAVLGNFLVLRKLSLMGDAISHAVLPGLAIAFLVSGSRDSWAMFLGAVVAGALTALLTQVISEHGKIEHGAAMGVVFSVLFAVGLVLIRRAADHIDLDPGCVLYGNLDHVPLDALGAPPSRFLAWFGLSLAVPPAATRIALVLVANLLFVLVFYKELKITSFDAELATTLGIRASVIHYALMIMVAITTVANFEAVGSILVIAMFIVPPVIAHLLTDRLNILIVLSLVAATVSGLGGNWLAQVGPGWLGYDMTVNTAGMMAVCAGGLLFITIALSPDHGIIARAYHRAALTARIMRQDVLGLLYRWKEAESPERESMPLFALIDAMGTPKKTLRALRSLRRSGHVKWSQTLDTQPSIMLSRIGSEEASSLIGSHRLWETFLARHCALEADHLHNPAERLEHYLSSELVSELRDALANPEVDPQGKAIPSEGPRGNHGGATD